MTAMLPHDAQLAIEHHYNKKFIDRYLRKEITERYQDKILEGVNLLESWIQKDHYASKKARLQQLQQLDLQEVVTDVLVQVAYHRFEELFTSVSAQLAGYLRFSDKPSAIATMAEVLAVLCQTDLFDICKADKQASLMLVSRMQLSDELVSFIDNATFLPPMVTTPCRVTNNHQSGYLTHDDSLILGRGNHHDGDICLDAINLQNCIPLKLDMDILLNHELQPSSSHKLITPQQQDNWEAFKKQSHKVWLLMHKQGNRFHLTNKVDKRGRLYSVGYHINTQGSEFHKAMVELSEEEVVEGI